MVRNMPDLPKESGSARYRRLAQECLENRAHLSGRGKADRSATDRASLASFGARNDFSLESSIQFSKLAVEGAVEHGLKQGVQPMAAGGLAGSMPIPKRMRSTRSSRGVSEARVRVVASRKLD
jgi:hypothetical protein